MNRSARHLALALALLVCFIGCNPDSNPNINPTTSSIAYVLANSTNTTIFNSAVVKAGLDSTFSGPSIFTVFVPNDQACIQSGFPQDTINAFTREQARAWVLYQTYAGTALTLESFIGAREKKLIMSDNDSIFVTGDSNRTYVNGVQLNNSEVTTTNGQMLSLPSVLRPPTQTLEQLIFSDTAYSFLNEAILLSNPIPDSISTLLSTGGPFTFLAPDNNAFRNLGYSSPADLAIVSPDTLRSLVLQGLIPQRLFSYDVADSSSYSTLNTDSLVFYNKGFDVTVQVQGSDTVSHITSIGFLAINGVLFRIDAILRQ